MIGSCLGKTSRQPGQHLPADCAVDIFFLSPNTHTNTMTNPNPKTKAFSDWELFGKDFDF